MIRFLKDGDVRKAEKMLKELWGLFNDDLHGLHPHTIDYDDMANYGDEWIKSATYKNGRRLYTKLRSFIKSVVGENFLREHYHTHTHKNCGLTPKQVRFCEIDAELDGWLEQWDGC